MSARAAGAAKQTRVQGARKTLWGTAIPEVSSCWNTAWLLSHRLNPLMELPETPTVPSLLAKSWGRVLHRGVLFQIAEDTVSDDKILSMVHTSAAGFSYQLPLTARM